MRFSNKTDIFFDLDHTLWDFEKNSALAFEAIFDKHSLEIPLEGFLEHYVPVNQKYWKLYRDGEVTQEQLRYRRLSEVFGLMSHEVSDDVIDLLSHEYIEYLPQFNNLYDGSQDLLDYLKPKYRLHIITNGFASVQQRKLENSNIGHYFEHVINSETVGVKKPNPYIFETAISLAGTQKEKALMIGDNIEADIEGALNAGIDALFFNEFRVPVMYDIPQVFHLSEIKQYL